MTKRGGEMDILMAKFIDSLEQEPIIKSTRVPKPNSSNDQDWQN